uniref:Cytochrome c oxidase assembly factor 3 n=1 Tax=Sphenodon punctatus TaxID=8508 RepID=A0A8D0GJK6_SPHPU
MAAPQQPGGERAGVSRGQRIAEPAQKSPVQQFWEMRRKESAEFVQSRALRSRNIITGLLVGGVALGIYGYTFFCISQEGFLDELEQEAKVVRAQAAKTSAN